MLLNFENVKPKLKKKCINSVCDFINFGKLYMCKTDSCENLM